MTQKNHPVDPGGGASGRILDPLGAAPIETGMIFQPGLGLHFGSKPISHRLEQADIALVVLFQIYLQVPQISVVEILQTEKPFHVALLLQPERLAVGRRQYPGYSWRKQYQAQLAPDHFNAAMLSTSLDARSAGSAWRTADEATAAGGRRQGSRRRERQQVRR